MSQEVSNDEYKATTRQKDPLIHYAYITPYTSVSASKQKKSAIFSTIFTMKATKRHLSNDSIQIAIHIFITYLQFLSFIENIPIWAYINKKITRIRIEIII